MANILMVNLPFAGHTNPTLPLAKALVERGHQVSYINGPEWREAIVKTGATFIPYKNYPENLTMQQQKKRCFLAAYETAMAVGKGYDIILYEMLFYPAKQIAKRLGLPCVRQFSQPAWNKVSYMEMRKKAPLFLLSCKLIDKQLMNKATRSALKMKSQTLLQAVLKDKPQLNIVYLPKIFQPFYDTFADNYLFVGQTNLSEPKQKKVLKFSNLKGPLIYISLGSIITSKRFYKKCISAFGNQDCSVVMTTGKVPIKNLGVLPKNFKVFPYAPQKELLEHADLFITHGGMNSVSEAMSSGVPMLVFPILNDQPMNAKQVEKLSLGKRMNLFGVRAKELYREAFLVLNSKKIGKSVAAIKKQAQKGTTITQAVESIERVL